MDVSHKLLASAGEGRGRGGVKRGRPGLDWLQGCRKRCSYIEMFILGQHPVAPQAEMCSSSSTHDLNMDRLKVLIHFYSFLSVAEIML